MTLEEKEKTEKSMSSLNKRFDQAFKKKPNVSDSLTPSLLFAEGTYV